MSARRALSITPFEPSRQAFAQRDFSWTKARFTLIPYKENRMYRFATVLVLGAGMLLTGCNLGKKDSPPESSSSGELKSGPQVGATVPGPFHPLNVTGKSAGQKNCLFCQNGTHPVAMIFARGTSPELTDLIKKTDASTVKHSESNMGSFVVFLNDSENLEGELKELAKKETIDHTVLSIDNATGPASYKVAKDAEVTVVLYTKHVVKANYAFKKGEMKEKDVEKIIGDVAKILPQK
jgi:hypothetical protein